jgi:myosin heavy subunit
LLHGRATKEKHHKYRFHDGLTGGLELLNNFHLTGQGGSPQLRISDEDGLKYTLKSMCSSMGFDELMIDRVLSIVAGILHLGQVKFESKFNAGGQEVATIANMKTVVVAAKLPVYPSWK